MQLLLECGADIQACSENGGTALHWACFHGGQASISVLVKAGKGYSLTCSSSQA
eukprot:m.64316 g.64316  ORF g.64316 m.64316 type:complete len:54 (+) comp13996_c0_seq21:377-538(+)